MGEGRFRKPQRRGRRPGGKTGRRLGGQGAGFVLRDHGSPGGLREASGGRTEVWEGQRDGDSREGPRQGLRGTGSRGSGLVLASALCCKTGCSGFCRFAARWTGLALGSDRSCGRGLGLRTGQGGGRGGRVASLDPGALSDLPHHQLQAGVCVLAGVVPVLAVLDDLS